VLDMMKVTSGWDPAAKVLALVGGGAGGGAHTDHNSLGGGGGGGEQSVPGWERHRQKGGDGGGGGGGGGGKAGVDDLGRPKIGPDINPEDLGEMPLSPRTRWGCTRSMQLTHSLKAPGFNPCPCAYQVKNWFQTLLSNPACTATARVAQAAMMDPYGVNAIMIHAGIDPVMQQQQQLQREHQPQQMQHPQHQQHQQHQALDPVMNTHMHTNTNMNVNNVNMDMHMQPGGQPPSYDVPAGGQYPLPPGQFPPSPPVRQQRWPGQAEQQQQQQQGSYGAHGGGEHGNWQHMNSAV
jgi:hypothetical protein